MTESNKLPREENNILDAETTKQEAPKEKEVVELQRGNFNYNRDKNGWVSYNNKKMPKKKLRLHISTLAKRLVELDDSDYKENRQILIDEFNKYGLPGVGQAFIALVNSYYDSIKPEEDGDTKL